MRLYMRECRRICGSVIYGMFIAVMLFSWFVNFRGITEREITAAETGQSEAMLDRPLLRKPTPEDSYYGSKISEEDTAAIMTGVTRMLLMEYNNNIYATYPLGYYKAITLGSEDQGRVLEILMEITGLTKEQLAKLPQDYFPAVTGTIFSTDRMDIDESGGRAVIQGNADTVGADDAARDRDRTGEADTATDQTQHFAAQVTYEEFRQLMKEMESIIGERGSSYSEEMMIAYFGMTDMSYEEAVKEYEQTIEQDRVTGAFARLFCDYMGLVMGLYPVFLVVLMWLEDKRSGVTGLIYSRRIQTSRLVITRYLACVTMVLLPVMLLTLESLLPLLRYAVAKGAAVDVFAYVRYIFWWLLPTVMVVTALGMFFTILTDSPIAIAVQFFWWFVDKGTMGLSGATKPYTLMIRHNLLGGYDLIQQGFAGICINRLLMAGAGIGLVIASILILQQKRRGRFYAPNVYHRCFAACKDQLSARHTK